MVTYTQYYTFYINLREHTCYRGDIWGLHGISYGFTDYIIGLIVGQFTLGMLQVALVYVSYGFHYKEVMVTFLIILDTLLTHIHIFISSLQMAQVIGLFSILDLSFIYIFLSMGMCVEPISWARDVRSLWDFRHWIPGKKSHKIDYSLGLFSTIGSDVIFIVGLIRHMDPTWHVELAWWHTWHDLVHLAYLASLHIINIIDIIGWRACSSFWAHDIIFIH